MHEELIRAQIISIVPITTTVLRLILAPERYIPYTAGQYLQILFNDEAINYSIANAPVNSPYYELHIRYHIEHNQALLAYLHTTPVITIKLPLGSCTVDHLDALRPIIFIAGGTGYAPINAMIEHLLASKDTRQLELFWSARAPCDLYLDKTIKHWVDATPQLQYFSFSGTDKNILWHSVLAQHPHDLDQFQIVISGPFEMVYTLRDALVSQGVAQEQIFSDAFSFE